MQASESRNASSEEQVGGNEEYRNNFSSVILRRGKDRRYLGYFVKTIFEKGGR